MKLFINEVDNTYMANANMANNSKGNSNMVQNMVNDGTRIQKDTIQK